MPQILGHQARFDALSRAVGRGKAPQTLLISGPMGVGKSTFVLAYARLLLCPNVQTGADDIPRACEKCDVCHQVEIESFPDFRVYRALISEAEDVVAPEALDSASILIKQARAFIDEGLLKPLVGARKVLWLHQFEKVTSKAVPTLLKTLEEPSNGINIVLTTDNHKKLLDTILSRCWHLPLTPVPDAEIFAWLQSQFPDAHAQEWRSATQAAQGRPGIAWREMARASENDGPQKSRFAGASEILGRLERARPVAAFALSEAAMNYAREWWEEDSDGTDAKKLALKGNRTAAARFLDELMGAARAKWLQDMDNPTSVGAQSIDLMRTTRAQILRNANTNLALDVMFSRLIELHRVKTKGS